LPSASVARLIKELSNEHAVDFKWSKEAINNIHYALEYVLHKLFYSALKVTVHSNRMTMQASDLDLTVDIITYNCQNLKL
jgi:histone H3/H4